MLLDNLTIEEAQRFYENIVPWVLDQKDLSIINRIRRRTDSSNLNGIDLILSTALWNKAQN